MINFALSFLFVLFYSLMCLISDFKSMLAMSKIALRHNFGPVTGLQNF